MKLLSVAAFIITLIIVIVSCSSSEKKAEGLAKQYCASCHIFPDPSLLDKKTWEKGVLPQMAFRMGIETELLQSINENDLPEVIKSLPSKPMVTDEQWQRIKDYYISNGPDSLKLPVDQKLLTQDLFDVSEIKLSTNDNPLLTFVRYDSIHRKIFIGSRLSKMYQANLEFALEDSFRLYSPPSSIVFYNTEEALISNMGIMDPNDQPVGRVVNLTFQNKTQHVLIDSIKRPADIQYADLNNDNKKDIIVSAFGNYTGALLAYERTNDGYKKHTLSFLPGSRKAIVKDFDNDGLSDVLVLITQGDEQITLFKNLGNFKFSPKTLLRFPPVYGSSFFHTYDFNNDGFFDILFTNGDNADYSSIFKPYHGIRIFLNDGKNNFTEHWFYPMYGASEAMAGDYDGDGDLDVSAISFFPDFKKHPEQGFLLFKNEGGKFTPMKTDLASSGRWLTMEQADIDQDGDLDLMLGALNFTALVPDALLNTWRTNKTSILLLRNKQR
jgi:hypothetical protein